MNTKLVESLVQAILSLSLEERALLESKLFWDVSYPSTVDIMRLAQSGGAFDFLDNEPDLYTLEDGELILNIATSCIYNEPAPFPPAI